VRHLPESGDPDAHAGLDWRGAVLAFGGLGSLVYGLIGASSLGWQDATVVGSLTAGTLLLLWLVLEERRKPCADDAAQTVCFAQLQRRQPTHAISLRARLGGAFFFPAVSF